MIQNIELDGMPEIPRQLHWDNSANVLCNYMKRQAYLDLVLQNQAIIPRYVGEDLTYLDLGDLKEICFPMTCFCDIPLSMVSSHMSRYGEFGIGLDKTTLVNRGVVQPIHYINNKSLLARDFKTTFSTFYQTDSNLGDAEILADYLVSTLVYMKPIWGKRKDKRGKMIYYVYQDECEWRYLPSEKALAGLPLIMRQEDMTKEGIEDYCNALATHKESWLKFEWEDVRYIIVPNEVAAKRTIETILKLKATLEEKCMLISKIEISQQFAFDR